MEIAVEQGQIVVSGVWLKHDQPNVKILYIDCSTKRPVAFSCSSGDELQVGLSVGTATTGAVAADEFTFVRLHGVPVEWTMLLDVARYGVYVVVFAPTVGASDNLLYDYHQECLQNPKLAKDKNG
jgi:hypothetical protein